MLREDRVLAGAAVVAIGIATLATPWGGAQLRSIQALLVGVPAAFGATIAWSRGERRIFAPPVALVVAIGLSGVLALARGATWTFSIGAAAFIIGGWLPWPRWRAPAAARTVLWALALAPLVVLAAAVVLGWSEWPTQLVEWRRIRVAPRAGNLPAWSLLWAALSSGLLAERGVRGARAVQGISLLLLGATGIRTVGMVAVGALAVLLWRDRRQPVATIGQRHGLWTLFIVTWVPRVLPRFLPGAGERDEIAGIAISGRGKVWQTYWAQGRDDLLTGGGIGRPHQIADDPVLRGLSTHNEYFWLALSVGVLGVLLVAAAWYVAFRVRTPWVLPEHPELLAPAVLLPVIGLVDDQLLTLTFVQPYLILLAAAGTGLGARSNTPMAAPATRRPT